MDFLHDYIGIFPAVVAVINGALAVLLRHYPFKSRIAEFSFVAIIGLLSVSAIGATFYSQHLIIAQRTAELTQRIAIREQLGTFITEGGTLLRNLTNPADQTTPDDFNAQVNEWALRAMAFLQQSLGQSFSARFFNDSGLLSFTPGAQISEERQALWRYVNARLTRLEQFSQELPPVP